MFVLSCVIATNRPSPLSAEGSKQKGTEQNDGSAQAPLLGVRGGRRVPAIKGPRRLHSSVKPAGVMLPAIFLIFFFTLGRNVVGSFSYLENIYRAFLFLSIYRYQKVHM